MNIFSTTSCILQCEERMEMISSSLCHRLDCPLGNARSLVRGAVSIIPLALFIVVLTASSRLAAQNLEYRLSVADEGTATKLNLATPLNEENRILPQATRGNIGTANLYFGYGVVSTSLNLTTVSDNLRKPEYGYSLRELSLDIPLTDEFDITVGKKILKWGTGYAFNPTGVVEPQRSPSDPTDRLGQNDGRNLIALTAFLGKNSFTAVYVNDAWIENWNLHKGPQEFALRAYTFVSGLDLSFVAHFKEGDRLDVGTNWSYVIGSDLELHGEVLAKRGTSNLYHQIITTDDMQQVFSADPYLTLYEHSNRIFYKLVAGGQYTFESGPNVVLEYYHNAEGLKRTEWQRWMKFVKFQNDIQKGTASVPASLVESSRYNLLWALRTLSPRGAMSDYMFGREYYAIGNWGFEFLQFLNVQDLSAVLIPSATYRASENVSLYGRFSSFTGTDESEFGALFDSYSFNLGIRFQL
jgi:hypothetical protein